MKIEHPIRFWGIAFVLLTVAAAPVLLTPARASSPRFIPGPGNESLNWSGYVARGGTYTSVSGSWIVPSVASGTEGANATWVGIGGVVSDDLIQAGTQAIVGDDGSVSYQAWYETLPHVSQPVSLSVRSGDSITASITEEASDTWLITIRNTTSGKAYQRTITYASSKSSAEWVEEMVSTRFGSFLPLDRFGSVAFTGGSAIRDGHAADIAALNAVPLSMINEAGEPLATPSPLRRDGASFTVARSNNAVGTATVPAAAFIPFFTIPPQSLGPGYIVITFNPDGTITVKHAALAP